MIQLKSPWMLNVCLGCSKEFENTLRFDSARFTNSLCSTCHNKITNENSYIKTFKLFKY